MTATIKTKNGDWVFSEMTGRPLEVEGTEKLRQDVRENLSINVQADGTGAELEELIGLVSDPIALRAEASSRIIDSFEALRQLQRTIQPFDRSREEKIARVARVQVIPIRTPGSAELEKTSFAFRVDILSERGNEGPITVTNVLTRSIATP